MADAGDNNQQEPIEPPSEPAVNPAINPVQAEAVENSNKLKENLKEVGESDSFIQKLVGTFGGVDEAIKTASGSIGNFGNSLDATLASFVRGKTSISGAFAAINKTVNEAGKDAQKIFGGSMPAAFDALKVSVAGFKQTGVQSFNEVSKKILGGKEGLFDMEKALTEVEKTALRGGMAFGDTFDEASESTNLYIRTLEDSIKTTRASSQEIMQVRDSLSAAFKTEEMVRGLANLNDAQQEVKSSINLTNVAILTATALGVDNAKTADIMAQAHLTLGETVDTAANAIADIAAAAEGSGLSFEDVSGAVMSSADALKMWGGTISSITPVFKSFVDVLGEGRKGLATDLLNKYAQGLQNMGFSTRALLGTIGGLGAGPGGGTAIGAGLQMEAALEDGGEGMNMITDNLIQTLNQFSGQQGIITRDQAIENPELERNFLVQRKLLGDMLGVDEATSNQLINILQDVEKNGLQTGGDTSDKLSELLKSGESTQESTQSVIERTNRDIERATLDSGKNIVGAIRDLAQATGMDELVNTLDRRLDTIGTGDAEESRMEQTAEPRNRDASRDRVNRDRRANQDSAPGRAAVTRRESPAAQMQNIVSRRRGTDDEQRQGGNDTQELQAVFANISQRIARNMGRLERRSGGAPSENRARSVFENTIDPLRERLNELGRAGAQEGGPTEDQEKQKAMIQQFINSAERAFVGRTVNEVSGREMRGEVQRANRPQNQRELNERNRGLDDVMRLSGLPREIRDVMARNLVQTDEREAQPVNTQDVRDSSTPAAARRKDSRRREVENDSGEGRPSRRGQRAVRQLLNAGGPPRAPVRRNAERAAAVRRRQEEVMFKFKSEPVEQQINLKITPSSESVKITVDEDHIKKVVREVQTGGPEN